MENKLNFQGEKTKNYLWADIAKGICIILVILGHSQAPFYIVDFIYLFHMPLFFLLAGYFFKYTKYHSDFKLLVKISAKRLLLPSLITVVVCYSFSDFNNFKMLLYATGKPVEVFNIEPIGYSLWFVFCLFVVRLFLWIFITLTEKKPIFFNLLLAFLLALMGTYIGKHVFLPWSIDIALVALYFAYTGYLLKKYKILDKKLFCATMWFLILIMLYSDFQYMYNLGMNDRIYSVPLLTLNAAIILSTGLIYISKLLEKLNFVFFNLFLKYLGINSLIIMMFHGTVFSYKGFIICTLWRLLISIILIETLALIPHINKIFSAHSFTSVLKQYKPR